MKMMRENKYLIHACPGCKSRHLIPDWQRAQWEFNGDFNNPTLWPSVRHSWKLPTGERVCHYFIKDGKIEYCSDSFHVLAGKTVDLPEIQP